MKMNHVEKKLMMMTINKTGYMTVNESGDINFAFGQLVHFKEEVER